MASIRIFINKNAQNENATIGNYTQRPVGAIERQSLCQNQKTAIFATFHSASPSFQPHNGQSSHRISPLHHIHPKLPKSPLTSLSFIPFIPSART